MKSCRRCLLTKEISEFHKSKSTKDGIAVYCKPCKSQMDKDWINSDPSRIEKRKERSRAWQKENPERYKERVSEWRKNNAEQGWLLDKKSHLWTHYRMTVNDFIEMFNAQDGRCKVCELSRKLVVDHDHSCCSGKISCGECVRGLVCFRCNSLLGLSQDSPELLKSAIAYLEKNEDN